MTDTTNLGPVIDVLADMRQNGIFSDYAIGDAVAGRKIFTKSTNLTNRG